jgi:hypothetical protein
VNGLLQQRQPVGRDRPGLRERLVAADEADAEAVGRVLGPGGRGLEGGLADHHIARRRSQVAAVPRRGLQRRLAREIVGVGGAGRVVALAGDGERHRPIEPCALDPQLQGAAALGPAPDAGAPVIGAPDSNQIA